MYVDMFPGLYLYHKDPVQQITAEGWVLGCLDRDLSDRCKVDKTATCCFLGHYSYGSQKRQSACTGRLDTQAVALSRFPGK